MKEFFKLRFILALVFFILSFFSKAGITNLSDSIVKTNGYMDFNGYYDTRNFSVLTINMMANFPNKVQYFSLTNYQGLTTSSDLGSTYSEQNLRFPILKKVPLDATLQYVMRSGDFNDDWKIGFRWRLSSHKKIQSYFSKYKLFLSVNPMVVQFRENFNTMYMTQIEYVYSVKLFPKLFQNKVYLSGFADQTFSNVNNKVKNIWVTEHQIGYNIVNNLYIVSEFRINQYMKKSIGLGYGLEYKISF